MIPQNYSRRILLCVTGMSPQIITETFYASVKNWDFVPNEIHLLTTLIGANKAKESLIDRNYLNKLLDTLDLPADSVKFGDETITVIRDQNGRLLEDVRDETDNQNAADTILATVRALTNDPQTIVHASLAGGRKTMSHYMGYAMSLFARPSDRVSHILVTPEWAEGHPDFYFPPKVPEILKDRAGREVSTADTSLMLAELPLFRLREHVPESLKQENQPFSQAVSLANRALTQPTLELHFQELKAICSDVEVKLTPANFFFMAWLAKRAKAELEGIEIKNWSDPDVTDYLLFCEKCADALENLHPLTRNAADQADAALNKRVKDRKEGDRKSYLNNRPRLAPRPDSFRWSARRTELVRIDFSVTHQKRREVLCAIAYRELS